MEINKKIIKELRDCLDEFNLNEIEYSYKDTKIKVSKKTNNEILSTNASSIKPIDKIEIPDENTGNKITSPIIGTAYLAAEPGGKKFVEVGKKIKKGDTIMIVEAMKTMNHVPSPIAGTVKKICVEDGQPVEYGHTIAIIE